MPARARSYFAPDVRRALQTALGLLWLLDGVLQFQSFMYSRGFARMLGESADGQPQWLAASIHWGAGVAAPRLGLLNTLAALLQVAIGLGLLHRRSVKVALIVALLWSLNVWWIGEGFGFLLAGTANPLTGAPGAVLLYALVGVLAWPSDRAFNLRLAQRIWGGLWLAGAWLWLLAANSSAGATHDAIMSAPSGAAWLTGVQHAAARVAAGDGLAIAFSLAFASAAIGASVLANWQARSFITLALLLNLGYWVIGQGLGGVFTGQATDPNTAPLFALLGGALYAVTPAPEVAPTRRLARRALVLAQAAGPSRVLASVAILPAVAVAAVLAAPSARQAAARIKPDCPKSFPKLIHDGFPEPRLLFSHGGSLKVTLREAPSTMQLNGQTVNTMLFNGTMPGPTLVACPGDRVTVKLVNGLSEPTNLHVHGLHVSPQADDVFLEIKPNQSHTYRYQIPLDQSTGSFWYHPHDHMYVQHQIDGGLAGAILIRGGLDQQLKNVPQALIVVQGGKDGGQGMPPGQGCHAPGFGVPQPPGCPPSGPGPQLISNSQLQGPGPLLVNGVVNPTLKIQPGQLERWRIFNATADRFINLNLHGQPFYLLARDGETLHKMQKVTTLLIGPGSRREVLVRGAAAGRYSLTMLPFQQCSRSCTDPIGDIPANGSATPKGTLLTVVSHGRSVKERLPGAQLGGNGLPDLRRAHVDAHRTVLFARMTQPVGPAQFPLNGKMFDPNRVDVTMQLNSVEQWKLVNPCTSTNGEWHNFHIHQNPFQVVSVNGKPLSYVDYEDTVSLPPCSTVVIRMRPIDFTGKFVFHCHLVFHEDQGMMGVVQVVRRLSAAQRRPSTVRAGGMITIASSAWGSGQDAPTPMMPMAAGAAGRGHPNPIRTVPGAAGLI